MRNFLGYLVDFFTSLGAVCGLFSLYAIYIGEYKLVWIFMFASIAIDSFDGTLARLVKKGKTRVDGELLDNMIDYLNYAIVPAFYLLVDPGVLIGWPAFIGATLIVLSSAYQFSQNDAKTTDHFFKGFPDYWNILVFYLAILGLSRDVNFLIVLGCVILVFVPIKYIYPSRIEFVTRSNVLKWLFRFATGLWGIAFVGLLVNFPKNDPVWMGISLGYVALYTVLSVYRTIRPLN